MKANNHYKSDFSSKTAHEKFPQINKELAEYFEGLPAGLVKLILREFMSGALESTSLVTLKKP